MQVIDGVFRNYRKFGYECTLDHGSGYSGSFATSTAYFAASNSSYLVRPAVSSALSFMQALDTEVRQRQLQF